MTIAGVLALQGDFAEHIAALRRVGIESREVRLPGDLENLDYLIVPGGESTTISRLVEAYELAEPLRQLAAERPVWGTCAGAIMMARKATDLDRPTLDLMDIEVERNAFGRQVDSFETDLDIAGITGGPFRAVFIRAPLIKSIGEGVEVLASLDGKGIVAARQGHHLVTVFHPELTHDDRLLEYFLGLGQADGFSEEGAK